MITVAIMEVYNPSTKMIDTLYFTSGAHFVVGSEHCEPLITGTFTFSQTIVRNSLTESGIVLDEGDITLNNQAGKLDKYKNYGFAGRSIKLYRVADEYDSIEVSRPDFVGRMQVPSMGVEEWVIPLMSRQQDLEVLVSPTVFDEDVEDPYTYIGGEAGVKGRTKPRLFGRCFSIQPVLLNHFLQIYGCNFDRQGNPAPVYAVHSVYSRGGRYTLSQEMTSLNQLLSYAPTPGTFWFYPDMGLVRLGTPPTGTLTMDASLTEESQCTVARLVERLLQDLGWQPYQDYNSAQLAEIDLPAPAGIYVESNETVLDVITALLQSVGAWSIPDSLGVYQFGKLEGVPTSVSGLIDADIYLKGSLKRLPAKTETGVPIKKLEFLHTRFWTQVNDSLPSIDDERTDRLRKEWDVHSVASSADLLETHPTAGVETVTSFLSVLPAMAFQDAHFYGQPFAGWWIGTPDWDILYPPKPRGLDLQGTTYMFQSIRGVQITDPCMITIKYSSYPGSTFQLEINGLPVTTPIGTDTTITFVTEGVYNPLYLEIYKSAGDPLELYAVECSRPDLEAVVYAEAARRHALSAGVQDCYEFVIPLDLALDIPCGAGVILREARFGLDEGKDFTVISREEDWDAEEVTMTVWRSEYGS